LVRPHLKYSVPAWTSHFRKDIDLLEGVQRRATKLITAIKDEIYEDRLCLVNLTTLETRILRGDLIKYLKYLRVLMIWILIYFLNLVKHIQEVTLYN